MNSKIGITGSSGVSGGRRKLRTWAGWTASVLPSLILVLSAAMKIAGAELLAEKLTHLGWPLNIAVPLGILELACVAIYLVPSTSVLGAILLTGFLGAAVGLHVRIGDSFVLPFTLGILVWLGLYLRDARLREVLPLYSRS